MVSDVLLTTGCPKKDCMEVGGPGCDFDFTWVLCGPLRALCGRPMEGCRVCVCPLYYSHPLRCPRETPSSCPMGNSYVVSDVLFTATHDDALGKALTW